MKSTACDERRALTEMLGGIDLETDPYVVKCYLDDAICRNLRYHETWTLKEALECLVRKNRMQEYYFYKGLCALCDANYTLAYKSFSKSDDKRNRLAQAYCLIHGMGTTVNHTAGRDILKDYPEDSFAMYLLTVSLFRTADHPKVLPDEVKKLLDKAQQLGYEPAESTRFQMELLCCFDAGNLDQLNSMIEAIKSRAVKELDTAADGSCCYLLYQRCLHRLLNMLQLGGATGNLAAHAYLVTEEYKYTQQVLNLKCPEVTPLAAFSRGLMRSHIQHIPASEHWAEGIHGFNQSPLLRKWGVQKALVDCLLEGSIKQNEELLRFYMNMGGSEKELLLWYLAIHIYDQVISPDFQDSSFAQFATSQILFGTYA